MLGSEPAEGIAAAGTPHATGGRGPFFRRADNLGPMRRLVALAILLSVPSVVDGAAVNRFEMRHRDTYFSEILKPGEFDEYLIELVRGTRGAFSFRRSGDGNFRPAAGLLTNDFTRQIPRLPLGTMGIQTAGVPAHAVHRLLVQGADGTVGGYRVRATLRPERRFLLAAKATDTEPATMLHFGAFEGYTFSVALKWKGTGPVTLDPIVDGDGTELASPEAPKEGKTSFKQGGFVVPVTTDYFATLQVPAGVKKWTLTVKLKGRLPTGAVHDVRGQVPRAADTVFMVTGRAHPMVQIVGEPGGPNDFGLFALDGLPNTEFADERAGRLFRTPLEAGADPTRYELRSLNGFVAFIESVVRDLDGEITSFDAPVLRSPGGSGSSSITGITYEDEPLMPGTPRTPAGWTEVRHYNATGRTHTLVYSNIERFPNTAIKTYEVEHTAPDGTKRSYQFAPFR